MSNQDFLDKVIELHNLIHSKRQIFILDMQGSVVFSGKELSAQSLVFILASLGHFPQSIQPPAVVSIDTSSVSKSNVLNYIKKPLINPSNNEVVGVLIELITYDLDSLLNQLCKSNLPKLS